MKYQILAIAIIIFLIPLVSADLGTYKSGNSITINFPCANNNSLCSASTSCNATIISNSVVLVNNSAMTNALAYHTYKLSPNFTRTLGKYNLYVWCVDGGNKGFGEDTFTITSSGDITQNFWDNSTIIIILVLAFLIFGFAVYLKNLYFSFIAGALFLLLGIYMEIYGFNEITNLYTRGLGMAFLGMGLYLAIVSAYDEFFHGGSDDEIDYEEDKDE